MKREPWQYDAVQGRPQWSKELARQRVIERQIQKDRQERKDKAA